MKEMHRIQFSLSATPVHNRLYFSLQCGIQIHVICSAAKNLVFRHINEFRVDQLLYPSFYSSTNLMESKST